MDFEINFTFSGPERKVLGIDEVKSYSEDDVLPLLFDVTLRSQACQDELLDIIGESEDGPRALIGGEGRINELQRNSVLLSKLQRSLRIVNELSIIPRDSSPDNL